MAENQPSRKANWTEQELYALVESVQSMSEVINGKHSLFITQQRKRQCWEAVLERVNSVSVKDQRSLEDVKKKWQWASMTVKKMEAWRARDAVGTGGGEHPSELKEWQKMVLTTIPRSSIHGIEGGVDSGDSDLTDSKHRPEMTKETQTLKTIAEVKATGRNEEKPTTSTTENILTSDTEIQIANIPEVVAPLMKSNEKSATAKKTVKRCTYKDDDEVKTFKVIELEEKRLQIEIDNHQLKKRKLELMEESNKISKRIADSLDGILVIMKERQLTEAFSSTLFEN